MAKLQIVKRKIAKTTLVLVCSLMLLLAFLPFLQEIVTSGEAVQIGNLGPKGLSVTKPNLRMEFSFIEAENVLEMELHGLLLPEQGAGASGSVHCISSISFESSEMDTIDDMQGYALYDACIHNPRYNKLAGFDEQDLEYLLQPATNTPTPTVVSVPTNTPIPELTPGVRIIPRGEEKPVPPERVPEHLRVPELLRFRTDVKQLSPYYPFDTRTTWIIFYDSDYASFDFSGIVHAGQWEVHLVDGHLFVFDRPLTTRVLTVAVLGLLVLFILVIPAVKEISDLLQVAVALVLGLWSTREILIPKDYSGLSVVEPSIRAMYLLLVVMILIRLIVRPIWVRLGLNTTEEAVGTTSRLKFRSLLNERKPKLRMPIRRVKVTSYKRKNQRGHQEDSR